MMISRSMALALSLLAGLACDSSTPAPAKPTEAATKPATPTNERPPTEPAPLGPAPAGTVAIGKVYVQTCAEPQACPALLQDAGATHCKSLGLAGLQWRLPTLAQLEAWRGNAALVGYDVFHWSGSAWDEDPGQLWIYDPGSGSKTTAKPDRKPFTIRCVAQP
jgi:hypothetical protein